MRLIFRAAAALMPLTIALFCMPSQADTVREGTSEKTRFEYAQSLYMQGAYDIAVTELKDFLRDFPKGEYADDAYYWLGKYYMMNGSFDEALEKFNTIITLLPTGDKAPAAQYEIAGYWYDPANLKHDYSKAMAEFLKIPFFYPDSPLAVDAGYYAALCQMKLRNYAKAEDELRAFMEKYPGSEFAAPATYELGMAYILDGKTTDALAAFQSVRDNFPSGLYRGRALDAIELILRTSEKRPLSPWFAYGAKGNAPGMLNKPWDVALDPEGPIYVADSGNGRIQRFHVEAGGLVLDNSDIVQPSLEKNLRPVKPTGIAVGPGGRVYITDSYMNRVQVFQPDGKLVLTFGRKGKEAGDMNSPSGITVDEAGNVYVADTGNRRVEKFDGKGRFINAIGNFGTSRENLLASPADVAVDLEGNVLVTDSSAAKVYKYDETGKLLMVLSPEGYELQEPAGIGVDGIGNIYVADRGKPSIVVFDKDLRPMTEYAGKGGKKALDDPLGLAVSEAGVVFIADQGNNQVVVIK